MISRKRAQGPRSPCLHALGFRPRTPTSPRICIPDVLQPSRFWGETCAFAARLVDTPEPVVFRVWTATKVNPL